MREGKGGERTRERQEEEDKGGMVEDIKSGGREGEKKRERERERERERMTSSP